MANSNRDDMSEGSAFYDNIEHVFTKICADDPEPAVVTESPLVPVEPVSPPPLEPIPETSLTAHAAEPPMDIVQSLLRFKWTLVSTFMLVSATLIWLIWTKTTLKYQARGEIRIRPVIPRLVFNIDENGAIPFYDSFVKTQVSVIRSLGILKPVLERPDIRKTRWYQNPESSLIQKIRADTISPFERLREGLVVTPRRGTEVVDLDFTCPFPEDAKVIVNAILDQYLAEVGDRAHADKDDLDSKRIARFEALQNEIQLHDSRISELLKSMGTDDAQALVADRRANSDRKKARLDELRQQQKHLQWTLDRQTRPVPDGVTPEGGGGAINPPTAMETQPRYYADAAWVRLDGIVMTLRHDLDTTSYGPRHHALATLRNDLAFQEVAKLRREEQLDAQWRDRTSPLVNAAPLAGGAGGDGGAVGADLRLLSPLDQIALLRYEEDNLAVVYAKEKEEFAKLLETVQLLNKETAALAHTRDLWNAVRQRIDQKNMERDVPGTIEILMRAITPSEPHQDRRIAFSCLSLILGLGLGGSAALIRAQKNQTIYTPKDLPTAMRELFLGRVPLIRAKKWLGQALWQEMEKKQSLMVEPIRVMRTMLLSRLSRHAQSAVLVSSAMPGTGKSSFTAMLGKSLAEGGKRVLLIDTDVHGKALSRHFKLVDRAGFIESVRDGEIDMELIVETETIGLSILPAGKPEKGKIALEQIANGALQRCLDQLSSQSDFNLILLDCPAILMIANTIIMASQVDGTIMVERERLSHRAMVAKALARLASAGGRLLGTVFVGSYKNEDSGCDSGYEYGSSAQAST